MALFTFIMPLRRIEDPVRRLWAEAVAAKTEAELNAILPQLQAAIREHTHRLKASNKMVMGGPLTRSGGNSAVATVCSGSRPWGKFSHKSETQNGANQ